MRIRFAVLARLTLPGHPFARADPSDREWLLAEEDEARERRTLSTVTVAGGLAWGDWVQRCLRRPYPMTIAAARVSPAGVSSGSVRS